MAIEQEDQTEELENENQESDESMLLGMSDDEISNMTEPPVLGSQNQESEEDDTDGDEDTAGADDDAPDGDEGSDEGDESAAVAAAEPKPGEKARDASGKFTKPKADQGQQDPATKDPVTPDTPVNYEEAYKAMMAPFKANGKTIVPQSPEEVIRLAQLGANYTKKMQNLAPNLKLMRMLENNGLLNEEKLTHFIDIQKKDPKAIAKLLKDTGIDALDLDDSQAAEYKPGNHTVSDKEMAFQNVVEEVASTPLGKETIRHIDKQWDPESKARVYNDPRILKDVTTQRENGIYTQITTEIERLTRLGDIDLAVTPFLDAYKVVGDQLHVRGMLKINGVPTNQMGTAPGQGAPRNQVPQNPPKSNQGSRVIERRSDKPRQAVTDNARARAASATRVVPSAQKAKNSFDVLSMSDEEFEKQANMR